MRSMWKKKSSPNGNNASMETAVQRPTTVAKGARENPFPSLLTISVSMSFLLTNTRTITAIPTPASIRS
jgi:hypothetical protein